MIAFPRVAKNMAELFKVGDFAVCEEPIDGFLTKGQLYKVEGLRVEEGRIVITDDRGLEGWFRASRFSPTEK